MKEDIENLKEIITKLEAQIKENECLKTNLSLEDNQTLDKKANTENAADPEDAKSIEEMREQFKHAKQLLISFLAKLPYT